MKKFISTMIAAVLLVSSLSVSVFAAAIGSEDISGGTSKEVYAKYVAGSKTDTYKVVISWGDMSFTYTVDGETWDPETHKWSSAAASWSVNTVDGNKITITNHSSQDVTAVLKFTAETDTGVTGGTFTYGGQEVTEVTVGNATSGTAQAESVTFLPAGALKSSVAGDSTIGIINITLN